MWTLLRGLSSRYGGASSYESPILPCDVMDGVECGELDEVDPAIAGKANIRLLKKSPFLFAAEAIRIISTLECFIATVNPPVSTNARNSDQCWKTHFDQLTTFGILEITEKSNLKFTASYFGIFKADGILMRSIYNGKAFSKLCHEPYPTNLPDITTVLTELELFLRDSQTPFMCVGDIRHWFHQLPLEQSVSHYFGLRMGDLYYRWCTLPMGFSWAPYIAQSVAYGVLLTALERTGVDVGMYRTCRHPPSFVHTPIVFACLWYDNIMVAFRDAKVANRFHRIFRHVCEKEHHIILKNFELFTPKSFNATSECRPTYLGLEFGRKRTRCDNGDTQSQLHWRTTQKKRDDFAQLHEQIRLTMCCRLVARIAGCILWQKHVRLNPMCYCEDVIEVVRRCGELCPRRRDWTTPLEWTTEIQNTLKRHLHEAVDDTWTTCRPRLCQKEATIATDSSIDRYGWCVWDEQKQLVSTMSRKWSDDMLPASIFLKELAATVIAVEHLGEHLRNTSLTIVTDNTASAQVMMRKASAVPAGNELVRRLLTICNRYDIAYKVVTCISEHNPADAPSRNLPYDASREVPMWTTIRLHDLHIREFDGVKPGPPRTVGGIKHGESEFDSEVVPARSDSDD